MARKTVEGPRYWIAVIPKSRVELAVAGGFAMFAHGRHDAVKRTSAGDWLAYYSPRTMLNAGDEVRAFTAIGRFTDREPYEAEMSAGRVGWRRDIAWREESARCRTSIRSSTSSPSSRTAQHWGLFFHRSLFSVTRDDFATDRRGDGA